MPDEPEIPEKLYKYTSFDNEGHYKDLLQNKLYFASPLQFNDPFDSRIIPDYENGSRQEIFNYLYPAIKKSFPHDTKEKRKEKFIKKFSRQELRKNIQTWFNDMLDKSTGIFSMTEKSDNLLMWSHYSDSHQGFCVEFYSRRLFEVCENHYMTNDIILKKRVTYGEQYPKINPFRRESFLANPNWATFKSIEWEYEKEWRLIYKDHPRKLLEIATDDIITAIYFGMQCTEEHIQEVKELTGNRKNKLKYYKAKMKRFEFGIDFEEI